MPCDICNLDCTRSNTFVERMQEIMRSMRCDFPDMFIYVDFWRLEVVSPPISGFSDDGIEVQVRLWEHILAFMYETTDRWYEKEEGIIRQDQNWLLIPDDLDIRANDHVIINGLPHFVLEEVTQNGISKLKIDLQKSRWVKPVRGDTTYRSLGVGAFIE